MRRDLELLRALLFALEAETEPLLPAQPRIDGYEPAEISYHIMLLHQAGLLLAEDTELAADRAPWRAYCLTWEGHEFLDAARPDAVWRGILDRVEQAGGGYTFELLGKMLRREHERRLLATSQPCVAT